MLGHDSRMVYSVISEIEFDTFTIISPHHRPIAHMPIVRYDRLRFRGLTLRKSIVYAGGSLGSEDINQDIIKTELIVIPGLNV